MKFFQNFLIILVCLFMFGCKKEEPNPEVRDPIYNDLSARYAESQKALDEATATLKEKKEALEKAEPNTIDRKALLKEIKTAQDALVEHTRRTTYYRIRSERRAIEAKISYKHAFQEDKPWPDPKEYSDYLINQRLRNVSLDWGRRVPKLQQRIEDFKAGSTKSEEKEAPKGH